MSKTNFDTHLEKYLKDPVFAEKFKKAAKRKPTIRAAKKAARKTAPKPLTKSKCPTGK